MKINGSYNSAFNTDIADSDIQIIAQSQPLARPKINVLFKFDGENLARRVSLSRNQIHRRSINIAESVLKR